LKRLIILAGLVLGLALLAVRCTTPQATLRYRMTVEVQTPSGLKSGSSVLESVLQRKFLVPLPGAGGSDSGGGYAVRGETPFVDLGEGRFLFATLHDTKYSYERDVASIGRRVLDYRELQPPMSRDDNAAIMSEAAKAMPFAVLRPADYPMLATFTDTNDPKSLVEAPADNLAARFGPGYRLSRITYQVVDKRTPLTTTLTARFPALVKQRGLLVLPPVKP
jgi:hypothetical protein